jgi:hypothetical protein
MTGASEALGQQFVWRGNEFRLTRDGHIVPLVPRTS